MTVILGDWRDVLPGTYDPERAIVITDPPYGLGGDGRGYDDATPWATHVRDVLRELPARRHAIRGPAPGIIGRDHPKPRRLCIEAHEAGRAAAARWNIVAHRWHGWLVYGRTAIEPRPTVGDAHMILPYQNSDHEAGSGAHRGITPTSACLWIVRTWGDPGMMIVDPFAGLGTIGYAAATLGLDYLGAELDPRWHAEAERLLARVQMGAFPERVPRDQIATGL